MAFLVDGHKSFQSKLPNGGKEIAGSTAIGHQNDVGGGARNAFGKAFQDAGFKGPKNCVKLTAMGMDKQMGLNWETLTAVGIQATLPKLPQNFHILEKIHQNLAV